MELQRAPPKLYLYKILYLQEYFPFFLFYFLSSFLDVLLDSLIPYNVLFIGLQEHPRLRHLRQFSAFLPDILDHSYLRMSKAPIHCELHFPTGTSPRRGKISKTHARTPITTTQTCRSSLLIRQSTCLLISYTLRQTSLLILQKYGKRNYLNGYRIL